MGFSSINMYTGGIFGLLYSAGPVAKVVVAILLVFSIISWTIMLLKLKQFSKTEKEGERFIKTIREIDSFKRLVTVYRGNPDNSFYRLMLSSYKEITTRQKENPEIKPETIPHVLNLKEISDLISFVTD